MKIRKKQKGIALTQSNLEAAFKSLKNIKVNVNPNVSPNTLIFPKNEDYIFVPIKCCKCDIAIGYEREDPLPFLRGSSRDDFYCPQCKKIEALKE